MKKVTVLNIYQSAIKRKKQAAKSIYYNTSAFKIKYERQQRASPIDYSIHIIILFLELQFT